MAGRNQCPERPLSLAGFQLITVGRFWVITEGLAEVGSRNVTVLTVNGTSNSLIFGVTRKRPSQVTSQ